MFARATRDTSDEYARCRIQNRTDINYLREIISVEAAREHPRQQRIAWANQRIAEVKAMGVDTTGDADANTETNTNTNTNTDAGQTETSGESGA